MRQKKSFDWYGMKQHFSIRKYHFGAASVLLGLSLATGAQAVKAEEVLTDTSATTTLQSATSTEASSTEVVASTEIATERTVEVAYVVQYVLADGSLVEAKVASTSVTTVDSLASSDLTVTAEVPAGYELAADQAATVTQTVTENGENIITVTVAPVATETSATETAATTESNPAPTEAATVTPTVPTTVAEAKVVLEQNISEAVVLSDEANRFYTAAPEGNESLKAAADATKLSAIEATTVLKDTVATLNQVNAQIDTVRTNVEALALELRKRDEDGVLTAMLTTTTTSTLGIGKGSGTLINTSTTATLDMTDPNGAAVTAPVEGTYVGTTEVGYMTVDFTPLSYYDAIMGWQKYRDLNGQSTGGAYFRTSVLTGAPSSPLLVELVDKTGSVLESKYITQGETASFTTFQATSGVNLPLEVTYRPDAGSTSIYGTTFFTFDENTMEVSRFIPQPVTATTYYKTLPNPDSTNLATYEIGTVPGATTTPSGQREFLGYAYDSTTTETTTLGLSATVPYVDYARANLLGVGHKTVVSPVDTNGTIVRDFYVAGTSVEGTLDYFSTDTTGFIHILTSSQMAPGESNTAMIMNSDLLDKGYKVYIVDASQAGQTNNDIIPPNGILVTDPAQLDFSSLSTTNHWFHIVINENPVLGELGFTRVRLGSPQNPSRIQLQYNTRLDGTKDTNNDGKPDNYLGTNIGFSMNNTPVYSLTETTHWYTPIPQIAQIIYQTEDGTQLDNIDSVTGNPGDTINYSTTNRINAYKLAGYELVSDGGPQSGQDAAYDYTNDDATDPSQKFYVVLKERIVDIPKDVVPGQPVDPTDPNSPVWPDTVGNLSLTEEVTRTITYVDEAGNEVATTFTDKVTFTRTAKVNLVTGEITYGAWTADNADNVLDGNILPEVPGSTATTATKDGADVTPESTTVYAQVAADSADIVEKVVYVQDTQTAKITISTVDANGENKTEFATVTESGKATDPIATKTTEDVLLELKALGYDIEVKVTDTFLDSAKTFDNVKDAADQPSQVYEIVVKERVVDVPKDVVPGQPVDPTDPNSPVWPDTVGNLTLTEEVTRTITYVDEAGNEVATTFTDKVTFTRTAQVNLVTGEITYGAWTADNADNVLDGNVLPEVPGYTATKATKDGVDVTPESTTVYAQVTADSTDIVEKVVYVQDTQTAKITISTVDANGENKTEFATVTETGKATDSISTQTVEEKLLELKRLGYDVEVKVTDTFLDSAKTFDNVKDAADQPSQVYDIVVKERVVDIPKDVVPGDPVDPTDPNSPVWPDTVGNLSLTEEVTRTITYVNEAGDEVATTFTDKVTFTRTAQVNLVTGEITYGAWTADNADNVLDGNVLPEVPGYTATKATKDGADVTPESTTVYAQVAADSADIVEKVVYVQDTQTAKITISTVDANGENKTEFATVTESGKATEPIATKTTEDVLLELKRLGYDVETKVTDTFLDSAKTFDNVKDTADQPSQSYEIVVKENVVDVPKDVVPGQPVDPIDPNSPEWPDTVSNLTLTEEVTRTITYVDEAGNEVAATFTEKVTFSRTAQVNLVTGEITYSDWTADNGDNVLAGNPLPTVADHQVSTATKDGVAALPTSTTSDVTVAADSADIVEKVVYVKDKGSVTIQYKDTDGNVIKAPVIDEDNVAVGTAYDTTNEGDKPTVIPNADKTKYVLVPSLTEGAETGTVVKEGTTVTYVYQKVANWIPVIPGVPEEDRPVLPYPFDPTNPTQPLTPTPDTAIPYVPGYVPVGPDGVTPLTPVDPEDPSKGYVPPTPSTPGDNTYIPYLKVEKGSVLVAFVDEAGSPIKSVVTDTDNAEVGTSYDTTDQKEEVIQENGFTYYFKEVKAGSAETGKVVEGVTTVTYVYTKVANWIPIIPGIPENERPVFPYPYDPTNPDKPLTPTPDTLIPYVPGYVPVGPDGVTPLTPVDPEDPSKGYVPPTPSTPGDNTYIPYVKAGSVVVKYQDTDGKELIAPVVDENNVKVGTAYDTTDQKKSEIVDAEGNRYVLVPSKTVGSETGEVTDGTTEVIYVYQKIANWIPQIPGVPENEYPVVPYPFDPTNPDKPVDPTTPGTNGEIPVIPYVPGYTPVDPKDNTPLKPVDPTDPNKGYVPPTPDETGVDTPIPYVQNGNVVVNYVTEDGTPIKKPVKDETDAPAGKSYDTTDNRPAEIVTEDGSRYVLIPSKTVGSETGTVEGGKTTEITYVYKKVANWIPQIPVTPENPTPVNPVVPYPFDPTNPDKPVDPTTPYPGGEVPSIPHVPGYTPVDPKTNEPLKPVDPTDPSKGYVPPTPDESGIDTPIPYVQNGNVVVNYVTEDGTVIKAPVQDETNAPAGKSYDTTDNKPGTITFNGEEYELVRVDGSETGSVEAGKTTQVTYVYRKVTPAKKIVTNHVDENGNPIAPQEDGTTPNKSIPGYVYTGITTTDENGNTTHIYRKVVTNHVDENGNPIAPQEEGTTPNKSIPGYEFTGKTITLPNGDTIHVYRKIPTNPVTPQPGTSEPGTPNPGTPKPASGTPGSSPQTAQLPSTGETSTAAASALGLGLLAGALVLAGKRRRKED